MLLQKAAPRTGGFITPLFLLWSQIRVSVSPGVNYRGQCQNFVFWDSPVSPILIYQHSSLSSPPVSSHLTFPFL